MLRPNINSKCYLNMENITTASTFPPKHELSQFFSFSIKFPKDLHTIPTSTTADRCSKCGSYLLQSEHLCPICNPINYFQKKSATFFNSFKFNIKPEKPTQRIFQIIFDLDMPIEELQSFSKILLQEGKKEEFRDIFFSIIFLGCQISFLSCDDDQIQFNFIPTITDYQSFIKPLEYYEKYLIKSIQVAKSYIKSSTDKKAAIENFFNLFQTESTFSEVQDIIYVYSEQFPNQVKYTFHPRFHLIQISEHLSKLNVDFACRFKASFFTSPHCNKSVSNHLAKLLSNEMLLSPHFTIITSPGIIFKDFSGSIQSVSQESDNFVKVELFSSTSQSIPVFTCSKTDKKRYNSSNFFSYQLVLHYFPEFVFIYNDVYIKANSIDQWIQSINRDFFLYAVMQSHASDLLNANIHLNSPWRLINRSLKIGRDFQKFYTYTNSIKKFFNELFQSSGQLLNENQKAYILFSFCYGSLFDSITFISAVFGEGSFIVRDDSKFIRICPFVFACETAKIEDANEFLSSMYSIVERRSESQFSALKDFIQSYQRDLQSS